jgi:hypothetical protein
MRKFQATVFDDVYALVIPGDVATRMMKLATGDRYRAPQTPEREKDYV